MAYIQLTHKKLFGILKDYKDGRLTYELSNIRYAPTWAVEKFDSEIIGYIQKSGEGLMLITTNSHKTFNIRQLKYNEKSKIIKIKDVSLIGYIYPNKSAQRLLKLETI